MKINLKTAMIIACFITGFAAYGFAEDTSQTGQMAQERIAQLKALKEENPEAFREELKKHRAEVREKLQKLREENQEKFKEVVEKRKNRFRENLKRLRQENPERFKQLTEKRRERLEERVDHLKTRNPEKYEHFVQKRSERLAYLKEHNPEQFSHFLENHPRFHERLGHTSPEARERSLGQSESAQGKPGSFHNRPNRNESQPHRLRKVARGSSRKGKE